MGEIAGLTKKHENKPEIEAASDDQLELGNEKPISGGEEVFCQPQRSEMQGHRNGFGFSFLDCSPILYRDCLPPSWKSTPARHDGHGTPPSACNGAPIQALPIFRRVDSVMSPEDVASDLRELTLLGRETVVAVLCLRTEAWFGLGGSIMVHSKTWKRGRLSWTYYSK